MDLYPHYLGTCTVNAGVVSPGIRSIYFFSNHPRFLSKRMIASLRGPKGVGLVVVGAIVLARVRKAKRTASSRHILDCRTCEALSTASSDASNRIAVPRRRWFLGYRPDVRNGSEADITAATRDVR